MPTVLVVPPELELTARNFLNASFIAPLTVGGNTQAGANQNVLLGSADLVVIPELSPISATRWYLLAAGMPIKPFIFQQREAPFFVYKNRPEDESMFWQHEMIIGAEARGNVGVSLPQLAIASQP
jgi:phage major head subunit gpT-like protein